MTTWSEVLAKIPRKQFLVKFSRSGGPGGQNVNKLNTKVTIRLDRAKVAAASWLSPDVRDKVVSSDFRYTSKRGDVLVSSELTRSQHDNLNDCYEKLAREISKLAFVPAEPSAEAKSRWSALAKRENNKRLDSKKRHATKKQDRQI